MDIANIVNNDFINQMPGLLVVLDLNSKFIAANNTALSWTGFKHPSQMIGKTYYDMHCKASEQHESFVEQDKAILKNNGHGKIFGLYCYDNDQWKIIMAEKYPLKNERNEIIALVSYISDLTHSNIVDVSKFLNLTRNKQGSGPIAIKQNGFLIDGQHPDIVLSTRQSELMFFLLRGEPIKKIAAILNLSQRTLENYIDDLKHKFNCYTKSELISKAISMGYFNYLPNSLFELTKVASTACS